ncbi:Bug family tripartite tricarboxylate transporter substrate binding protein [Bordetella genomosp. 13]|uniref:Bug family tripartite tricarboxylate transporter substrate binding protein n=1 Tax=Bordetella genomosp. 13 TaxID=463040 RepID=UPI0021B56ED0|nr:tripartite tricarboxylate transporter substrate binding protein [Bordetella genomosp. 13]
MHRRSFMGAMGAGMLAASGLARAQGVPTRIIVGATPGGGTDLVARLLAAELARAMGGTFVVDNRPGAGGNIAAQTVAHAEPDGRTLLVCYTSHAINATLYPNLAFDPVKDFSPVSSVATAPSILLAHPSVQANTLPELIALAKKEPGKLNMALPGIGSAGHLGGEILKMQAGIDMVMVPYKGTAPAMTDLLGGQVQLMFAGAALAKGQLQGKVLKPLGISSAKRMENYPDIPPIADTLPGYDFSAWYGLLGPKGMDPKLVAQLSQATVKVLSDAGNKKRLLDEGLIATGSTPEAFSAFVQEEVDRWGKVVKASGAKAG